MTGKKRLSICIPTYKRPSYLSRCLDSLRIVKYDEMEILVQDNCSGDDTKNILKESAKLDHRISYTINNENIGPRRNVVSILKKAKGEYVFCLTDDDFIFPQGIEHVIQYIEQFRPHCFKTDYVMLMEKTNDVFSRQICEDAEERTTPSSSAKIFFASHVLSGLCFKREMFDIELLEKNIDNYYPSMIISSYFAESLTRLPYPVVVHTWGNETFWGIPNTSYDVFYNDIISVIKLMEGKKNSCFVDAYYKEAFNFMKVSTLDIYNKFPKNIKHRFFYKFAFFFLMKKTNLWNVAKKMRDKFNR
jgi:glycosyltransferase involved in cell wall biosynthesis